MAIAKHLEKVSLIGSVTESAANTFTQSTIMTSIGQTSRTVFICSHVFTAWSYAVGADEDQQNFHVAYASQTAVINCGDPDWFIGENRGVQVVTTGGGFQSLYGEFDMHDTPIAVPTLYLGSKSTALGSATTCAVRLVGYYARVTETEFFRLANCR